MRCLVADDSQIMRARIKNYLQHMSHTVIGEADSAKAAYEFCVKEKPDIAILDVLMPPGDGRKAAIQIREERLAQFVIVCSSQGQDMVVKDLEAHGIYMIRKPLSQEKFIKKAKAVLDGNSRPGSVNSSHSRL